VRRSRPRQIGESFRGVVREAAPQTLLAAVQTVWAEAAGETVARQAEPVSERDGEVTVACRSASWAQELDLLQDRLREQLNERLGGARVTRMRFTADAARHEL
jgi:predicted nucleic acid-binding Zn ribbon protein